MKIKIEQRISVVEDDADFHLAMAEATHNKIQTHLMFSIYDLLKESLGGYYESIKMQDIFDQHCKGSWKPLKKETRIWQADECANTSIMWNPG